MNLLDKNLIRFLFKKDREIMPAQFFQRCGLRGLTKAESKRLRARYLSIGILEQKDRRKLTLRLLK